MSKDALRGVLRDNEPMASHVSWRAGGVAAHTYVPADLDDLAAFLRQLPETEPLLMVGLGSNLLIRDGGYRGTVVFTHNALKALRIEGNGLVYAEAGVASPKLARFAATHQLGGGEFFAGIPGTLGGALAMNAGCHGGETWERVVKVLMLDRRGRFAERNAAEFAFPTAMSTGLPPIAKSLRRPGCVFPRARRRRSASASSRCCSDASIPSRCSCRMPVPCSAILPATMRHD